MAINHINLSYKLLITLVNAPGNIKCNNTNLLHHCGSFGIQIMAHRVLLVWGQWYIHTHKSTALTGLMGHGRILKSALEEIEDQHKYNFDASWLNLKY